MTAMSVLSLPLLVILMISSCVSEIPAGGTPMETNSISRQTLRDFCLMPPSVGNCRASIPRVYFDATTHTCKVFNYAGCGGNKNRFSNFSICHETCSAHRLTVKRLKVLSGTRVYEVEKEKNKKKEASMENIGVLVMGQNPGMNQRRKRRRRKHHHMRDANDLTQLHQPQAMGPPEFHPNDFRFQPLDDRIFYSS